MFRFFNKSSLSFILAFMFFVFASITFLVGVSSYVEAEGVDVISSVLNFLAF